MPRMRSSTLARPRLPSIPTLASRMSPRYVSRQSERRWKGAQMQRCLYLLWLAELPSVALIQTFGASSALP